MKAAFGITPVLVVAPALIVKEVKVWSRVSMTFPPVPSCADMPLIVIGNDIVF